jgi:hypothetical protein
MIRHPGPRLPTTGLFIRHSVDVTDVSARIGAVSREACQIPVDDRKTGPLPKSQPAERANKSRVLKVMVGEDKIRLILVQTRVTAGGGGGCPA